MILLRETRLTYQFGETRNFHIGPIFEYSVGFEKVFPDYCCDRIQSRRQSTKKWVRATGGVPRVGENVTSYFHLEGKPQKFPSPPARTLIPSVQSGAALRQASIQNG